MPITLYYSNDMHVMPEQDYFQVRAATQLGWIGSQACFHTPTATKAPCYFITVHTKLTRDTGSIIPFAHSWPVAMALPNFPFELSYDADA